MSRRNPPCATCSHSRMAHTRAGGVCTMKDDDDPRDYCKCSGFVEKIEDEDAELEDGGEEE